MVLPPRKPREHNQLMPETKKINLNQEAVFTLTPRGIEIVKAKNAEIARISISMTTEFYRVHDGKIRLQLWQFAELFGSHLRMGFDVPVETWFQVEAL